MAISYLPIRVPHWAELSTDPRPYERSSPIVEQPAKPFALTLESRCSCGGTCSFNPNLPKIIRECKVYTLHTSFGAFIELQSCPTSAPTKRRFIGPDLHGRGLFNYNNMVIFSHDLLDDYTSTFCTSETPFVAWVTVVSRRYGALDNSFIGEDLFRSVWFAYVKLQQFPGDMVCSLCGPYPDTIIWDGVTLAFGRKKLLGSLQPPTISGPGAQVRASVKYQPRQQLIGDASLRKRIRQMLKGPIAPNHAGDSSDTNSDEGAPVSARNRDTLKTAAALSHIELVDSVQADLRKICMALSDLVLNWFGPIPFQERRVVPAEYRNFLRQVSHDWFYSLVLFWY